MVQALKRLQFSSIDAQVAAYPPGFTPEARVLPVTLSLNHTAWSSSGKGLWETQLPGFTPEVGFLRSLDVARVRMGVGMSTPLHYTRQALSCSKGQKFATGFAVQRTHQVVKVELYVEGTSCAQAP